MTSLRAARFTTSMPAQAIAKAKDAAVPHCPGETHAGRCVEQQRHEREVGGVEDVLAAHAEHELRADGDGRAEPPRPASASVRSSRHSEAPR